MAAPAYLGIDTTGSLRLAERLAACADDLDDCARDLLGLLVRLILDAITPDVLRAVCEDQRTAGRAIEQACSGALSFVLRPADLLAQLLDSLAERAVVLDRVAPDGDAIARPLSALVAAQLVLGLRPAVTVEEALVVIDGHRDRFDTAHEARSGDGDAEADGFVSLDDLRAVVDAPLAHPAHVAAAGLLVERAARDDGELRERFERPSWWERSREWTHLGLDVAGLIPIVGNAADALNAGLYVVEGDVENALISVAGALPGGEAATGMRIVDRAIGGARWAGRALDVRQTEDLLADADSAGDVARALGLQAVSPALHHAARASLRRIELDVHVRLRAQPIVQTIPLGGRGLVPRGFVDHEEFRRFGATMHRGLHAAGYRDAVGVLSGSASTGKSYLLDTPFDHGRRSDFDVGLSSPALLDDARRLGVQVIGRGTRTKPVPPAALEALGLGDLQRELSKMAGRKVDFVIYESVDHQLARQAGTVIPPG
jgi:hypothetical protein